MNTSNPAARQAALVILFILMIAFGLSTSLRFMGNTQLALQICLGAVGLIVLVLVVGAVIVAANRNRP